MQVADVAQLLLGSINTGPQKVGTVGKPAEAVVAHSTAEEPTDLPTDEAPTGTPLPTQDDAPGGRGGS